jgi:glycosyltransferase involved in cell wall biosynthesis
MNRGGKNSKIKVVEIVRSAHYGGVENQVYALLKQMDPQKYRPILISLSDEPVNPRFVELDIEIVTLKDRVVSSYRSFLTLLPLRRVLRKIKPDVVHLHGIRPIFIGSLAARMAGVKTVISTLHASHRDMSMDASGNLNFFLLAVSKLMHLIGFSLSTRIITISNYGRNEIKELFKLVPFHQESTLTRKMETIYNGIDVKHFGDLGDRHSLRKKLGIGLGSFVFGTISRLDEPKKGIAVFLRAASLLLKSGYSAHFLITGEGFAKDQLVRLSTEQGLGDRVFFLGYWDNLKVREVLGSLDVFVLPSLTEGFGLVNLEAMAAGLPVISTVVGGVPEGILQNRNGILVPANDARQLASAMSFLMDYPEIGKRMGCEGKKRVEREFEVLSMTEKIFSVYDAARNRTGH